MTSYNIFHHLNHHDGHTRTVPRVEGELIDGKASVARLPLQHQPERLPHVHRHLGATRLSSMDSFRWLEWTKSAQDLIIKAKLVLIGLQKSSRLSWLPLWSCCIQLRCTQLPQLGCSKCICFDCTKMFLINYKPYFA